MSEQIKHECGIAMIRLRKPLSYYQDKYGSALYGLNKLKLLMQKMRNRGQDGAGMASLKLNVEPGRKYISRKRSNASNYLDDDYLDTENSHVLWITALTIWFPTRLNQ